MIWLFRVDEVFWGNKPKVNKHYLFDTNDINFDITKYDISLYFATSNYFLIDESNDKEIYYLIFNSTDSNPIRRSIGNRSEFYNVVKSYYIEYMRDEKINEIIETGS